MAVHLLIVDALNLIRRIHAVQGSPCVEACQHALDQLIVHSQPTHAVAVFDDEARNSGWRHQLTTKPVARRCLTIYTRKCPPYAPLLNSAASAAGYPAGMKPMI